MKKFIEKVKALWAFVSRQWKWLRFVLFGIVVVIATGWLTSKLASSSSATQASLDGMAVRLKKYHDAYEKAVADSMKKKSKSAIETDFDHNFGGKA
jgi:hypothetical protein